MKLQEQLSRIKELSGIKVPKVNRNFLYHSTNIKHLDDIKSVGLIPDFGETVRSAYGGEYDFDKEDTDKDWDEERRVELDFDGILFFSDTPLIGFSQPMQQNFKWDECLLVIVKKNDSIYRKVDDNPKFVDMNGQTVSSVNHISVHDLPIMIETGDYFSFDEQEPYDMLYGDRLKTFIQQNYPDLIKRYPV